MRSTLFPESYKKQGSSCLFVGKGPSAELAKEHLSFGDLATVNEAALLFSRVDFSFWGDVVSSDIIRLVDARRPIYVLPDRMHKETWMTPYVGRWRVVKTPFDIFPSDRTILYPYYHVLAERDSVLRAMKLDRVPLCSTAVAGLYVLATRFQYKHILCYGFDGGRGYVKGMKIMDPNFDYTVFRNAMEIVAEYVGKHYGTIVEWGS